MIGARCVTPRARGGANQWTKPFASNTDRLLSKFDQPSAGCWLWKGGITGAGYGNWWPGGGTQVPAHRAVYEHFRGPIPEGMQLDHLCRVTRCVRPDHLEVVTRKTNILRGVSPHAAAARRTHCVNGHEFTEENTRMYLSRGKPARACRTCARDYHQKLRARNGTNDH